MSRAGKDAIRIDIVSCHMKYRRFAPPGKPVCVGIFKGTHDWMTCSFTAFQQYFRHDHETKIYDKRDDFDFDIVNFPFLDGDVPRSASYGVYISQLIRFARVSSHVDDFNTRNKDLTAKLLRQGYRYHKLRKEFSKFYRRHFDIVSKYNVGLKTRLLQGLSEPEFYGDLVYKFRKIIGKNDFPYHVKKIIVRYKKIGYNINVMRQTACLVVNPIKVNSFAYLFNCTTVGRTSD